MGCALHIAALEAGERPMDWKPSVCWQVPLRLEHSTDESGHVTSRLREWKRRDWGEGGSDFEQYVGVRCQTEHKVLLSALPCATTKASSNATTGPSRGVQSGVFSITERAGL